MGLDLQVMPKQHGNREITASETAGMPIYDPKNPEHIAFLQECFDGRKGDFDEFQAGAIGKRLADPRFASEECVECIFGATASPLCSPFDFRGKIIVYTNLATEDIKEDIFSDELEDPDFAYSLGTRMIENAEAVMSRFHLTMEDIKNPKDESSEDAYWLMRCGHWLQYWGQNGHGIFAWF